MNRGYLVCRKVLVISRLQTEGEGWEVGCAQVEVLSHFAPRQFLVADLVISSPLNHRLEELQQVDMLIADAGFRFEIRPPLLVISREVRDELIVLLLVIGRCFRRRRHGVRNGAREGDTAACDKSRLSRVA